MPDPVNLADVLADVLDAMNGPLNPEVTPEQVRPAVAAVLAYGGGDPVVVMPDGTLWRGSPLTLFDWAQRQSVVLTDPVAPDA